MRSRRVLLAALAIAMFSSPVRADYCPTYYYGLLNGVHYHYCKKKGQCDLSSYMVGDSRHHTTGNCVDCADPIAGNPGTTEDDPPTPETGETDVLAFMKKSRSLKDFVPKRKAGGKPGDGPDAGLGLPDPDKGQFYSTSETTSVVLDEVVKVSVDGKDYYFRVLAIEAEIRGKTVIARIGQETSALNLPTTVYNATLIKALGIKSTDPKTDSHHWKIQTDDAPKRYFYVLRKK